MISLMLLYRSQMNGSRVGKEAEGNDPPHADEREDESRPFLIGDVCHGEVGHGGADAGVMQFVKASPKVNAKTAVCRVRPTMSASGAMIGMEMAACPELEGTRRLKQSWMMNIPNAMMEDGKISSMPAR